MNRRAPAAALFHLHGRTGRMRCLLWALLVLLWPCTSWPSQLSEVQVSLKYNEVLISTAVKPDAKLVEELSRGMTKEFIFFIDVFRVWTVWPDEFVLGKRIERVLKSDPIKREHLSTSLDGAVQTERRFKTLDSMIEWALSLVDARIPGTAVLEPGEYFVKVTVESRVRKLPPVIGYLLFFVPEKEFTLTRNSSVFRLPAGSAP